MRNISTRGRGKVAARFEAVLMSLFRQRGMRDPIAQDCEELGLTPPQLHALMWLGHEGPLTMGDLARLGGITEKTITGVVDRLEREDLVHRDRDAQDRRVVRVLLTAKGSKTFTAFHEQMGERLEQILSLMGPADQESLLGILERLRDRLAVERAKGAAKKIKESA